MNVRLLKASDTRKLEEYLVPCRAECMFICSNLQAAGIEYKGADFQGEYFGYFNNQGDQTREMLGVIVHYWNGNVMMHASNKTILEELVVHLKKHAKRPIAGVLGPNIQAEYVIKSLGLASACFAINRNEGLFEINLAGLNEVNIPSNFEVVAARDVPKSILIKWMKSYDIEALGASNDETLEKRVETHWNLRLQKNDSWVLLADKTPIALSAFNARLTDMAQVGPVWTPFEYRNKGFARLLLAYILHQEKRKGTKQAILFTDNPVAIKAYLAIGFKKIGDYRLALFEKPINLQDIEFTTSPTSSDIEFLTDKINKEKPEFGDAYPFAFYMRDEEGNIIAGCNGSVVFGSIYTDQLWVHPDYRGQGISLKLMNAVHEYGRKSGCFMANVNTMSFQGAQSFYEKLGYVVDFERSGYVQNSSCIFLKRSL